MLKDFSLEGKVAIVTGAGRGLGQAIAVTLAEAEADVVCAGRTAAPLEETARRIQQAGRRALAVPTDVTRADQVEHLVQATLTAFGKVDILVNNAGALIAKPVAPLPAGSNGPSPIFDASMEPATEQEWRTVVDTNLTGPYLCCRAVGPHMLARRSGKVINIISVASAKGFPFIVSYAASKAALANFTRSLAIEWGPYNINVNAIGPSNFPTAMNAPLHRDEKARERTLSRVPLRRFGDLRQMGLLTVYLASEASSYMTGQCIYLDGGNLA